MKKPAAVAKRNQDVTLSKALSYVLRHAAPSLGLEPSPDGYVPVEDILSLSHSKFRDKQSGRQRYTVDDVIRVVEMNEKRRFKLEYKSALNDGYVEGTVQSISTERNKKLLCIRANQGHSFKAGLQSNKLLMPLDAGELNSSELIIVHGTTQRAWELIRIEGLRRMKRNHIHFATGLPNENGQKSPISGMRSSSEIYIYISGKKCAEDAIPFYRSDNGVILTAGVDEGGLLPIKYFDKVVQASSGNVIWKHGQDWEGE
mmetsp:Transcript_373/g.489  ORF Transcript_373/g.489 Transcript_373/m.489 type:complete len:258 (-) Transcript_373:1889-2662(-)